MEIVEPRSQRRDPAIGLIFKRFQVGNLKPDLFQLCPRGGCIGLNILGVGYLRIAEWAVLGSTRWLFLFSVDDEAKPADI